MSIMRTMRANALWARARSCPIAIRTFRRCLSDAQAPAPTVPLLQTIRDGLKAAMKAKDTERLNVIRSLMTEINNAAKTNAPISTDSAVASLIRKRVQRSKDAAAQFEEAGRKDLAETENAQIVILRDYIKDLKTMSESDIGKIVSELIAKMKAEGQKTDKGAVMKALLRPGGVLDNQSVDKGQVARFLGKMAQSQFL